MTEQTTPTAIGEAIAADVINEAKLVDQKLLMVVVAATNAGISPMAVSIAMCRSMLRLTLTQAIMLNMDKDKFAEFTRDLFEANLADTLSIYEQATSDGEIRALAERARGEVSNEVPA